MALDISDFEIAYVGDAWRHVNHKRRLATVGWVSLGAARRNAGFYRGDDYAVSLMAERYNNLGCQTLKHEAKRS